MTLFVDVSELVAVLLTGVPSGRQLSVVEDSQALLCEGTSHLDCVCEFDSDSSKISSGITYRSSVSTFSGAKDQAVCAVDPANRNGTPAAPTPLTANPGADSELGIHKWAEYCACAE
jgi:hypothetical protein